MAIAITWFFGCCFFLFKFLYFLLFFVFCIHCSYNTMIAITIFYLLSLWMPMPSKVLFLCFLNSHGFLCCLCSPATLPLPKCCFFFTFFLSHFFTALLLFSNPQSGVTIPIFSLFHCSLCCNKKSINVITTFSEKSLFVFWFSPGIYSGFDIFSLICYTILSLTVHWYILSAYQYCKIYSESLIYSSFNIFSLLPPAGVMHNWAWARHDSSSRLGTKT